MAKLLAYTVSSGKSPEEFKTAILKNLKTSETKTGEDAFSITFDYKEKKLYMIYSENMVAKDPNMTETMVEIKSKIDIEEIAANLASRFAPADVSATIAELQKQIQDLKTTLPDVGDGGILDDSSSGQIIQVQADLTEVTEKLNALETAVNENKTKLAELTETVKNKVDKSELANISSGSKVYDKFVVIGVYGQSNSVGYDESPLTLFDVPRDPNRIKQYSNELKPLTYMAESIQMMNTVGVRNQNTSARQQADAWVDAERATQAKTKGIHLPLANLVIDAIPDDYGVIIVPGSYGGLGIDKFVSGQAHYTEFVKRLKAAMDQNENNIFAGIIWCQGENNAGSMASETYMEKFKGMTAAINAELAPYAKRSTKGSISDNDWYFFEWPLHYKKLDTTGILPAMKEYLGGRYVSIPDETPSNTTTFTSATAAAHFGQNSFRTTIAPRVFNAMQANGAFLCNSFDNDTKVDSSAYVSFDTYDTLNKRFTLLEKLSNQLLSALKAADIEVNTKVKVTADLFTGHGQFDLTETGANYSGPLGSGTYCKYVSEGFDTFYMDANVASNTTYGIVVAMNRETKEYLWIYSDTGAVMKNTDSAQANTFAATAVTAQGLGRAIQSKNSFKFVRTGTSVAISKLNGDQWQAVKTIDFGPALTNIGLSGVDDPNAAYVWGFCVGWSKTLAKSDNNLPVWDNLYVDNQ